LLNKYNEEIKKNLKKEIAERKGLAVNKIDEIELDKEFRKSAKRNIIDFYITKSVFIKYAGLFELYSKSYYNIHIIEKNNDYEIAKNLSCYVIEAKHDDLISDRDSVGFLLSFNNTSLIYTGDTGWSKAIRKQYKMVKSKCKNHYKLLVAHIGGFDEIEDSYFGAKLIERKEYLYKNHLGRIGLTRINELLKPDVCIISEFGEEFKGHREELTKIYQEAFENNITFLPADIGLKFNLEKNQFEVITAIDADDGVYNYGLAEPKDVRTCVLNNDQSLHYYKGDSGFTEANLIQIIRDKFDESTK
jgi:hypothetical protein